MMIFRKLSILSKGDGEMVSKSKIVGSKYQNLVTGNIYQCIAYDGQLLTLEGIGKLRVTFRISWQLVLENYREIREEEK